MELKRLLKGSAIYGTGQVLNRLIAFLLLPIFTAYLSPKQYGVIAILAMLSGLLACIFSFGVGVAIGIYYFIGERLKQRDETIWMATIILVSGSLILMAIGAIGSEKLSLALLGTIEFRFLVFLAIVNASLEIITQPSLSYLQFEERSTQFVIISLVTTIITLGSSIFFIVILEKGVLGLMQAWVISRLVSFSIYFTIVIRSLKFSFNYALGKQLLGTGFPYVVSGLCFFLIQYADRYMLEIYSGLHIVGVYSVGYSMGMIMVLFVAAFSSAWTPYFNSFVKKQQEAQTLFGKVFEYYIVGMGLICLGMFLFAKPVVVMMTTLPYYQAYTVVGLIALSQLIYGCYLIFLPGLYYARKSGKVNFIIFIASCINITLNMILIPKWNMYGATLATVISFLVMAVFTHFAAKKYLIVHFDWLKISKYIISWGLCIILFYFIPDQRIAGQVLIAFLTITCFIFACFLILNHNEKAYLRKVLHDLYGLRKLKWKKC